MVAKIEQYKNWKLSFDEDNILWLAIDRHERSANSLSQDTIKELRNIIKLIKDNKLNNNGKISGLIIYSNKKSGFIAGADVTEFREIKDLKSARTILENGQNAMNELEALKIPTVAMIDGFCLGGGFELALACDYIAANDDVKTKIGLPEVMLGIIPGWGGTVRLSRRIGGTNALPLMMQGRSVSSIAAKKLGMIDAAVPLRQLKRTARHFVLNKPSKHKANWLSSLLNYQPFRNIFCYLATKQLKSKAKKEHYPAPYKVLSNWNKYGVEGKKPFNAEINSDIELIQHPTARNLMRIFFLQENLKEQAKKENLDVQHVHVIGGGTMGGDIAAWCAFKGFRVTLQDQNYDALSNALQRAFKLFKKKLKKHELAKLAFDRIIPDVNGYGIKSADVIIEAVFEDLNVKHEIFKRLEAEAKPNAILATNTSSIPLDEINTVFQDKSRLAGIHFFNPVAKMMLVEVVKGHQTSQLVADQAACFVNKLGKLAVPVASKPGFLVNRVLAGYMHETFILLSEGKSPESVDNAMKDFGMPMGPVEMADIVGLDICLSVANNISSHYGEEVPELLKNMVNDKKLGKKTNKGFYDYKNGKIIRNKSRSSSDSQEITNRLVMRVLNTCVSCIREEVVDNEDLIDTALIFGAGFAPFRGGPMNYLNTLGKEKVIAELCSLESKYGERFRPDQGFDLLDQKNEVGEFYEKASGQ